MVTRAEDNQFPYITLVETADPSTPAANTKRVWLDTDGTLKVIDEAAVVTNWQASAGAVATDTIWDEAGDLAVGTGANTAAKLSLGATNGMSLRRVSGAVAWDLPPGHEFDYAQVTSNTSITATAEASANTVVTAGAVTYDGSTTIMLEFFAPNCRPRQSTTAGVLLFWLFDGSSSIGAIGNVVNAISASGSSAVETPVHLRCRLTPSAASHTYSIRCTVDGGTGNVSAGAAGTGNYVPAFIRQVKA